MLGLNQRQRVCVEIVNNGHNLAILGQAGTGKSFVVDQIYRSLVKQGKNVSLTCTTGIACKNYEVPAMTIHRWSGIVDGRYTLRELCDLTKTDRFPQSALKRITETEILVIDEISMLSEKLFHQVDHICRTVRNENRAFGGLQVIVSGDFRQLPPVPNVLYGDEGRFVFLSNNWPHVFPHTVILDEVVRQSEEMLIRTIHEASTGQLSEDSIIFVRSLSRSLPEDGTDSVKLFPLNSQVDRVNRSSLLEMNGDLKVYTSDEQGSDKFLKHITAPKVLWLKVGCPVMVIANISEELTNGSRGVVEALNDEAVTVRFQQKGMSVILKRKTFTVYDPKKKQDVAVRVQFPLTPCFAMTIHKAQGMTLERVEIDCRGIFKAGQLAVALGRARSIGGLRVVNFQQRHVMQQPGCLSAFYEQEGTPVTHDDLSCCKSSRCSVPLEHSLDYPALGDMYDMTSILEDDEALLASTDLEEVLDDPFLAAIGVEANDDDFGYSLEKATNCLSSLVVNSTETGHQGQVNNVVAELLSVHLGNLRTFCKRIIKTFVNAYTDAITELKNKNITDYYSKCHNFQTSQTYRSISMALFQTDNLSEAQCFVVFKLTTNIRLHILNEKAVQVLSQQIDDAAQNPRFMEDFEESGNEAKAKVRYVAGYVFAKLKWHNSCILKANMFKTSAEAQKVVSETSMKMDLLDVTSRTQSQIESETIDFESLKEIAQKQNVRQSLTNVSDVAFDFSKTLCCKILHCQTEANLHRYGKDLHNKIVADLTDDTDLFGQWILLFCDSYQSVDLATRGNDVRDILNDIVSRASVVTELYSAFVQKFVRVLTNQFRKDILKKWDVEKKTAHRINVLLRRKQKVEHAVPVKDMKEDKSDGQLYSHHILKANLIKDKDYMQSMKKDDIKYFCRRYNVKILSKDSKAVLLGKLVPEILKADSVPTT